MAEDAEYLKQKGALSIPDAPLRDELVQCFAQWVYPWTPMLDLHQFIHTVGREDGTKTPLSLLLVQAVMFAGAGFADLDLLKRAGFESHKDAKRTFFNRAKVGAPKLDGARLLTLPAPLRFRVRGGPDIISTSLDSHDLLA